MGVSTHLAQSPLEIRFLAPRQGSAAYSVSDIQIQPPGSWDTLCPCPLRGSWSRRGSGPAVLSPSSAAVGNPGVFLSPTLNSLLC